MSLRNNVWSEKRRGSMLRVEEWSYDKDNRKLNIQKRLKERPDDMME